MPKPQQTELAAANLRVASAERTRAAQYLHDLQIKSMPGVWQSRGEQAALALENADKELLRAALGYARSKLDATGESGTTDACLLLLALQAEV